MPRTLLLLTLGLVPCGKLAAEEVAGPRGAGEPLPPGAVARLGTTRLRHPGLCAVAFAPDGKTLATAGTDRRLRVWDGTTGHLLREAPVPRGHVRAVLFRGAEPLVCTSLSNGTVRLTTPF